MNRQQRAIELFMQGYNCAQAIAGAFCNEMNMTEEEALQISCAFGAGFALTRGLCGTLSGMGMVMGKVIGDTSPQAKKEVYAQTKKLLAVFDDEFQSINCEELLKNVACKSSEQPMERDAQYYKERPCTVLVAFVAQELEKWIAEYKQA